MPGPKMTEWFSLILKGERKMLGKRNLPDIKAFNNEAAICIWQNEKEIHSAIVPS